MATVDFAGRRSVSEKKDWCTPQKIVDAVKSFFGGAIDLDPCSNDDSIVGANREIKLPVDGLAVDWSGYKRIYVNPPYGKDVERGTTIRDWLRKCGELQNCDCEIVALIPVATNTEHWKRYVFGCADAVCFLYDTRLKFRVDGSENNKGSPMACALVYWGCGRICQNRLARFFETMSQLGNCVRCRGELVEKSCYASRFSL